MRIRWLAVPILLIAGFANAQTDRIAAYPSKPLRIICNAAPDGYTIATVSPPHTAAPSMMPNLPYDTLKDLVPIRQHSSATYFVLVRSTSPYKALADLVHAAKARPGALAYASSGIASPPHLVAELFSMQAGIKLFHVPFNGAPAAMTAMLGDQPLDIVFATALTASTPLRNGRLRGLANSGATRMAAFPEVPTVAEQGFADFEVRDWQGFVAPAGTPKVLIDRIAAEIGRAVAHPDVKNRLTAMGMEATAESSPEAFGTLFRGEYARWARVIREAGIRVE
jgi:tripartite-type tricarboxylate transporter receptor subunit TctC